ncbi:MAG: CRISPR-associated helicase Cas3' [Treponema sp.]|jgi:CRISPR-associated endonuclease/helicase Cas3|nr:CRISPR-associated helicase Cas3' [Treponema sp.]
MICKARFKTNSEDEYQLLTTHLEEVGMYVELFAKKIGLPKPAKLIALLHDLGKNNAIWQKYLEENHKTGKKNKKEDHGTAGGQYLYDIISKHPKSGNELIAQLLSACIMYHHGSGLPDVIKPDGTAQLSKRLEKSDDETHLEESTANLDVSIKQTIESILADNNFFNETMETLDRLTKSEIKQVRYFYLGLTARFLSSCLIDGDRRSSALYDKGIPVKKEEAVAKADWKALRERLEKRLAEFPTEGKINEIRREVSQSCAEFAKRENGLYTLTAATGAGKTFASLRYALAQAERTGKDRIFIIAPYTSILDQNAKDIRSILDPNGKNGQTILEHHSNLDLSEKLEHFDESSETWNAPIIITTMVQFLEALFGAGTRKIRRMHQLANSVIVLDEVQTLPVYCTFLFNWAIQYLCQNANVSILLSTATQPGLDRLPTKYALPLSPYNEIIADVSRHFEELKRVELVDKTKDERWTLNEVARFIEELDENSILTVVNTKNQAWKLYIDLSSNHPDWNIIHLSANMCPAHRKLIIDRLKEEYLLNKTKKCVCISTRLIEAGVDIDFDCAIRFFAGFDSIIQTAGRCNRNGKLKDSQGNPRIGKTYIVNIIEEEENIDKLPDLIRGQKTMERILREFYDDKEKFNHSLMHPRLISNYFLYYYKNIPDSLLKYKVTKNDDTILDLLSDNSKSKEEYEQLDAEEKYKAKLLPQFRQSFESAWNEFEVIAQDTMGVIVPFDIGKDIIGKLHAKPEISRCVELLQEAQQYSVNVFYNKKDYMLKNKIIKRVSLHNDLEIYTVDEKHYDINMGLTDIEGKMTLKNV